MKISTGARLLGAGQIVFTAIYFGYLLYVGFSWGFTPRLMQLFITDSIFLFFLISSAGLFMLKPWGWWVTAILWGKLLLSRVIGTGTEWFMISSGLLAEQLDLLTAAADLGIIILLSGVLLLIFTRAFRQTFRIHETRGRLLIMTGMGVIVLYAVFFTVTLAVVLAAGL
ncbi:hypothetical protein [Alteribacter natronophilus]|uniref:hypothetical protein n=1 Tax=Alteribacter natronophilus TaxID=2583810 RepID=UPI00110D303A|nr:hypothetical protein [Alteribacter natronophilus]TMW73495.1 hypothetical protein FGB90_04130 [Alteribacter natronophilus]